MRSNGIKCKAQPPPHPTHTVSCIFNFLYNGQQTNMVNSCFDCSNFSFFYYNAPFMLDHILVVMIDKDK